MPTSRQAGLDEDIGDRGHTEERRVSQGRAARNATGPADATTSSAAPASIRTRARPIVTRSVTSSRSADGSSATTTAPLGSEPSRSREEGVDACVASQR